MTNSDVLVLCRVCDAPIPLDLYPGHYHDHHARSVGPDSMSLAEALVAWEDGVQDAKEWRQIIARARSLVEGTHR